MRRDPETVKRAATSVMSRLKDTAKNRRIEPRKLILRYVLERWLHRLSVGPHAESFVLKGGMLMPLLGDESRPTEDIDANFDREMTHDQVRSFVRDVCSTPPLQEDGIVFDTDAVSIEAIRDQMIPGCRVGFVALIAPVSGGTTEIRIKLDLCYGDVITPDVRHDTLPTALKGFDGVFLAVYPWPTVVAEKLHAIARHGVATTRLKDFYDLLLLSRAVVHSGRDTTDAVRATFEAWGRAVPTDPPGLSAAFAAARAEDWSRYMRKERDLKLDAPDFRQIVSEIADFVLPMLEAAAEGTSFDLDWTPGAGWERRPETVPKVFA